MNLPVGVLLESSHTKTFVTNALDQGWRVGEEVELGRAKRLGFDWMGGSNELKVGGELLLFLFEELLLPDTLDAVIVVIAGDGEDWNLKVSDGFACGRHELFLGCLCVEQITRDQTNCTLFSTI